MRTNSRAWALAGAIAAAAVIAVLVSSQRESASRPLVPLEPPTPLATTGAPLPPAADAVPQDGEILCAARTALAELAIAPASLRLLVEQGSADAATPAADVDVAVWLDPAEIGPPVVQDRTDAAGRVQLEVPGATGRRVTVRTGIGGAASTVLGGDGATELRLTVDVRAQLRGRVVDECGNGVPAADLIVLRPGERRGEPAATWRVGRSDREGHFAIGLDSGVQVGAIKGGRAPSALFPVRAAPAGKPALLTTLELVMFGADASVHGQVRDTSGRPVAAARIEFRSRLPAPTGAGLPAPPHSTLSGADGQFVARGLSPGELTWIAAKPGHGSSAGAVRANGGNPVRLDIRLGPACGLRGTVATPAGEPVGGAQVQVDSADLLWSRTAVAAPDGSFRFDDLPPGPCAVSAAIVTALGERRQVHADLVLSASQPTTWRAVLDAPVAQVLAGSVTNAAGGPLSGHCVWVRSPAGRVAHATTAADGSFAVVPDGLQDLEVRVFAPGRATTGFADAVIRGVDGTAGPLRIVVEPPARGGLRGRIHNSDGSPADAVIVVWHHGRREHVRFHAGADGTFALGNVPAGTVDLECSRPGQMPALLRDVEVLAAVERDLGSLSLGPAGELHGSVRGPLGTAPAACELAVITAGRRIVAEYAAGHYRFAALPPGHHVLQVQGEDFAAATFAIHVDAGVARQQDVLLLAGLTQRIRVAAPPGSGTHVTLVLREAGAPIRWFATAPVARADADAPGTAEFLACMAPGSYEAVAWGRGTWQGRTTLEFPASGAGLVSLRRE